MKAETFFGLMGILTVVAIFVLMLIDYMGAL